MANTMTLIKKTAKHFYLILKRERFFVELEELEGEFGLIYAIALKKYDPAKSNAAFETYFWECCLNTVKGMRRKITEDTKMSYCVGDMLDTSTADGSGKVEAMDCLTKLYKKINWKGGRAAFCNFVKNGGEIDMPNISGRQRVLEKYKLISAAKKFRLTSVNA